MSSCRIQIAEINKAQSCCSTITKFFRNIKLLLRNFKLIVREPKSPHKLCFLFCYEPELRDQSHICTVPSDSFLHHNLVLLIFTPFLPTIGILFILSLDCLFGKKYATQEMETISTSFYNTTGGVMMAGNATGTLIEKKQSGQHECVERLDHAASKKASISS